MGNMTQNIIVLVIALVLFWLLIIKLIIAVIALVLFLLIPIWPPIIRLIKWIRSSYTRIYNAVNR
jgi:hypothetical protein